MLKIRLLGIGKDKDKFITEGSQHYLKLLSRFAKVEEQFLPSLKLTTSLTATQIKSKESDKFEIVFKDEFIIALDDSGIKKDTHEFAHMLQELQSRSKSSLTFIIGGAYGLDKKILKRADMVLSLSPLTFSHQLVRLVLLEQLYRCLSLNAGHSYHK